MNKYLLNSGLILIFLCFSTTLTVIALPDGFYFSTEIRKGNKYEWELTSNINNYVVITENISSFYQGSKIVIEVTKDPINIDLGVITSELADPELAIKLEELDDLFSLYDKPFIEAVIPQEEQAEG